MTGASRGLGRAIAKAAAVEGAVVVAAARSGGRLAELVAEIEGAGGRASAKPTDVGELAQVRALLDHALAEHGRVDVWINNAGVAGPYGPTLEIAPEDFEAVIDTNLRGTYHGSLLALRHFRERGQGRLINLLGRGDKRPVAMQNAYATSKAAIRSLTLALAEELREHGQIHVHALNPGLVRTELLTRVEVVEGHEDELAAFPTIIRMWARPPEQPAAAIVELAAGRRGAKVEHRLAGFASILARTLRFAIARLFGRAPAKPQLELHPRAPWAGPRPPAEPELEQDF